MTVAFDGDVCAVQAGDDAARAALLSVHPHFEGLDEAAAAASSFGALDATVLALLDEVTFELVATKEADSYGDSSAATVTATRGARSVSYEVTGGVMPLGTYQAAYALHRDARRSRRFAGQLFTADEVESLTRFLWPSPSRVGASGDAVTVTATLTKGRDVTTHLPVVAPATDMTVDAVEQLERSLTSLCAQLRTEAGATDPIGVYVAEPAAAFAARRCLDGGTLPRNAATVKALHHAVDVLVDAYVDAAASSMSRYAEWRAAYATTASPS